MKINANDNNMIWVYYRLTINDINSIEEKSLPTLAAIKGFRRPSFLVLHGSRGAPIGCIHPIDANYWRIVETEHLIEKPSWNGYEWQLELVPLSNLDEEIATYARTRWYAFTLNGMSLIAKCLFALTPDSVTPILSIKNDFGLIGMIYDEIEEIDIVHYLCKGKHPLSLSDWISRARDLLADKAVIDERGYELYFTTAELTAQCGIVYEISPFEGEWLMWDAISSQVIWRGFGIREDYSDFCLCCEDDYIPQLVSYLKQFCEQEDILLLECLNWCKRLEFDSWGREIFPPNNCSL